MAKSDLTLNIGTKYNGEGMKKLDNALKSSAKSVNTTSKALGSISSELGQIGGAAGKATQAVAGLFSSFAASGPVGIAIAAITTAVGLLVKAFNDAKQRAKEAADYMRKGFQDAFDAAGKRISSMMETLSNNLRRNNVVDETMKEINDINSRRSIRNIQESALAARAQTKDESEQKRITAKEQRDIGIQQAQTVAQDQVNATLKLMANKDAIEQAGVQLQNEINRMAGEIAKQRERLDKVGVAKKFEELSKAAEEARKTVQEKGEEAIVGTKTRFMTNQYGLNTSYEVGVTAKERLEQAVSALKKFEEANGDAVKDIEELGKIQEQLAAKQKEHEKIEKQYQEALSKYILSQEKDELAIAERDTKIKQLNEKYDNELKSIDKQIAANAEAAKKKAEAEEKTRQAEAEKQRALQEEQDRRRGIQNLEIMRERVMNQDKQTAVQRLEAHKKEMEAAKKLAEAEKKASEVLDDWKDNTQNTFGEWNRAQRQAAIDAEKQKKRQERNAQNATDDAARVAKRIFNRDGSIRKSANAFDIGRFAEQSDYLGFKNVSEDQLQALQDKREQLRKKLFNDDGTLKRGVNERGQDVGMFKKLDKALKNVDAVKEAEKQKKDAEAREKKRAENEDKRTKALDDINTELKNLTKKVGL